MKSCFPWLSPLLPSCLEPGVDVCKEAALGLCTGQKENPRGHSHLERLSGASLIHPSVLESPGLCSPGTAVPSPRSSHGGPPGMLCKPQAHIFRQPLAGHRSSPRHLVNLGQICSDFVWVAGFHQEGAESSNPRRGEEGGWIRTEQSLSSCPPFSTALYSPLLKCQLWHNSHGGHEHFYMQAWLEWGIVVSLNVSSNSAELTLRKSTAGSPGS